MGVQAAARIIVADLLYAQNEAVAQQAQRGIVEFSYRDHEPGLYMFHAHQSEFAELGWMSLFEVA